MNTIYIIGLVVSIILIIYSVYCLNKEKYKPTSIALNKCLQNKLETLDTNQKAQLNLEWERFIQTNQKEMAELWKLKDTDPKKYKILKRQIQEHNKLDNVNIVRLDILLSS